MSGEIDHDQEFMLFDLDEDRKYPEGLGRNMMFLKYIYPIFKEYLDKHGFVPLPSDLEFSQRQGQ